MVWDTVANGLGNQWFGKPMVWFPHWSSPLLDDALGYVRKVVLRNQKVECITLEHVAIPGKIAARTTTTLAPAAVYRIHSGVIL